MRHCFPMSAMPPCTSCGGVAQVELDVHPRGFGCGSGFDHASSCPTLLCPHGIAWTSPYECIPCEEQRASEDDEEVLSNGDNKQGDGQ